MLHKLTLNNHFQFGYNEKPFNFRQSPGDRWFARYGRAKHIPFSFYTEALKTARVIHKEAQRPVVVLFSGGVDSEIALRAFVYAGLPVSAATLKFKGGLNDHDVEHAVRVCRELSVRQELFNIDILEFWETKGLEYASTSECCTPLLLSLMYLVDQVAEQGGYSVIGSGECLMVKDVQTNFWHLWEKEKTASLYRFYMRRNYCGCPGFFQYTPEIMLAWLLDPFVRDMCQNQLPNRTDSTTDKLRVYRNYFNLELRPKYTGFELIWDDSMRFRSMLNQFFGSCDQVHKTPYDKLVLSLMPESEIGFEKDKKSSS